jgi:hypothetical protein
MHRLTCICDDPCSLRSLGDDFGNWLRRIGCRQQKQAWHEEEQRLGTWEERVHAARVRMQKVMHWNVGVGVIPSDYLGSR